MGTKQTAQLIIKLLQDILLLTKELSAMNGQVDDYIKTLIENGAVIIVDDDEDENDGENRKRNRDINVEDVHAEVDTNTLVVRGVPKQYKLVHRSYLSRLEKSILITKAAEKLSSSSRYPTENPLASQLFAAALLAAPALSLYAAEAITPIIITAYLAMVDPLNVINANNKKSLFSPSASTSTLKKKIIEYSADCLILFATKIEGSKVYITCDKGNKKRVIPFCKSTVVVG